MFSCHHAFEFATAAAKNAFLLLIYVVFLVLNSMRFPLEPPKPSILFSRIRAISLQPNEHCLYYYFTLSSSALFFIYLLWTLTVSYVRASTTH